MGWGGSTHRVFLLFFFRALFAVSACMVGCRGNGVYVIFIMNTFGMIVCFA